MSALFVYIKFNSQGVLLFLAQLLLCISSNETVVNALF